MIKSFLPESALIPGWLVFYLCSSSINHIASHIDDCHSLYKRDINDAKLHECHVKKEYINRLISL